MPPNRHKIWTIRVQLIHLTVGQALTVDEMRIHRQEIMVAFQLTIAQPNVLEHQLNRLLIAKMIDFPVRKCAHATEYAVLGVLILRTAYSFSEDSGKRSMLICWCAGTAYAASDELHQLFVPGRSCQFRDVCIDSAGVLAGVLVFSLIKHEIVKYKEKKKSCKN